MPTKQVNPMPTPWSVKQGEIWSDQAGEVVGVVFRTEAWTQGEPIESEDQANAAFLVRAANCHADLLLAVKCLCEEMADYMAINKLGDPTTKHNYRLGMAAIAKAESDEHPLDKHLREAAIGKTGLFRDHACWKCRDGAEPCVRGEPNRCEYPYARND